MCRLPLGGLPAAPGGAAALSGQVTQHQKIGAAPGKLASGRGQYDDDFLQFQYKVVPCNKSFRHDFATCPFAHAGESSERRHPSAYLPFLCGATQHSTDLKEKCPFGPACQYAHSHFELWLHPGRFRTKMCSLGERCKRPVCFFAHNEAELRATPYSKLDTAAAVAAQQLADMGQLLEPNSSALAGGGSLACSTDLSKACAGGSSLASSSDTGRSGTSSPTSLSCDDAAALAQLTASMAGMRATAAPAPGMLAVGGMARLHAAANGGSNPAYLAAAAAAIDASLSGDAASLSMASTASGMWPLQQQQPQQVAQYCNAGGFVQQQAPALGMLDAQLLSAGGSLASSGCSDMWLLQQQRSAAAAAPQWAAAPMLAQPQLAYNAPVAAAGLPLPSLLATAGLQQTWAMPLEAGLCTGMPQQQPQMVLSNQAMQQLLGMM